MAIEDIQFGLSWATLWNKVASSPVGYFMYLIELGMDDLCPPGLSSNRMKRGAGTIGGMGKHGEAAIAFTAWPYHVGMRQRDDLLDDGVMPTQCMVHRLAELLLE